MTPRGARFAGAYGDEDSGKHRKRDQAANDGRRLVRDAGGVCRDVVERVVARGRLLRRVPRLGRSSRACRAPPASPDAGAGCWRPGWAAWSGAGFVSRLRRH
ncbi:hypothetical protein TPA0910_66320 [Streptomyces hygroscopicus subsp. sporocinereus]|uniref:Uncharacterized protein n=1 Tax=Streptomyces hygroscopicus TaxID=1912 RepID=A0ABQ3U9C2_STRHY|nr:hypothetical protein TPA0910_66320 [Streptomyces hygroscopicus]